METMELDTAVFAGLSGDSSLTALLPNGADSIFHLRAPSDNLSRYPAIVYSVISDVPALIGDDDEIAHRVTYRIHVITLDGQYGALYRHIHRVMAGLGFSRIQSQPYSEDDEKILLIDYRIGVNSEWQQSV